MSALPDSLVASTFIAIVSIDWACSVFSLPRLCAIAVYVFLYVLLSFSFVCLLVVYLVFARAFHRSCLKVSAVKRIKAC